MIDASTGALVAPFPYFGGKRTVADIVWRALGPALANYVEPFFGGGAVLLARPGGAGRIETVNDFDGMVANFWRAVTADPDAVACWADWPVNENDQHARHAWLVQRKESLQARLEGDPDWYDAKIAGWWCWGMCCWIGAGWCSGNGPWSVTEDAEGVRQLVHLGDAGRGIKRKLVHLGNAGRGINRQLVHLGNTGQGINRQLVHLGNTGQGINRQLVHLGDAGRESTASSSDPVLEWMQALSDRLRRVRVCCGDWSRVCGPTPTVKQGTTGVFLDPPYSHAERQDDLYRVDHDVERDVIAWAKGWGDDPRMRIALCGYDNIDLDAHGWHAHRWKAKGGYGSQGNGTGRENAGREVIWFSPHCLSVERDAPLFAFAGLSA